jgi:pyruvate,water dikinase
MKGIAVSQGIVTGKVVFINDSSDLSKVTKETILVLESATPVYAPFYTLSGGIISEMGGRLSHGAIVAREYGIPMLTGVENACVILKEGQSITLDADQGIVKVD